MERRRLGLKWLNFLYSFNGFLVVIKGGLGIGTLYTIIDASRGESAEELFTVSNALTFFAVVFFLTDAVFKLLACITSGKKEGYSLFIWAMTLGVISNSFYVFEDQGLLAGSIVLLIELILFAINYFYVSRRKWVYGNPDLL